MSGWVDEQLRSRGIADARVLAAMAGVPRELFVPAGLEPAAYDDEALPIGCGQTISQPYIVAVICESLALRGDERVLDVGTGSGYQAAVLSSLAAEVVSIELLPELAERAARNLERAGLRDRVDLRVGDGTLGVPDRAPFGGIAVAAAAARLPPPLWQQLAPGARIVLPLGGAERQFLEVLERGPAGARLLGRRPVRFVPLVGA